jgi:hypothetical protein
MRKKEEEERGKALLARKDSREGNRGRKGDCTKEL